MRSVDESLETIKADVEAMLGVDVDSVKVDQYGVVVVRISLIGPDVWECCQDPTFGVDKADENNVEVRDGREDIRLPTCDIEIRFEELVPEYCGPRTLGA